MSIGSTHTPSDSTSRSLLRRAKAEDPAAWAKLSQLYSPLVYQWCRRAGLQANDAADVVQEVFRAVFRAIGRFEKDRPNDSFRGWLWTITRNKLRDHFRGQAQHPPATGGAAAQRASQQLTDDAPEDSDEQASNYVMSKLARRAMALMQSDFKHGTWRAFWLTTVDELPPADVARQLGMSVAAVYMAKSRVLRRLREELDGLDLVE